MKTWKTMGTILMAVLLILVADMPHAQIVQSGNFILNPDGSGSISLKFESPVDEVAGIQGHLLFDPSRFGGLSLSIPPSQPGSFIVRTYQESPGKLNFVLYSPTDVLNMADDVLVCHAQVDTGAHDEGFSSVLVVELEYLGEPDLQIHREADAYMNVPVIMPAQTAIGSDWRQYL